jgi:dinuclear metal center YbgI/SA1388 family protein
MGVETTALAEYLDSYLRVDSVPDSSMALNGLQVANGGEVTRVAAAVDASEEAIEKAIAGKCDLLLVHHGLFWDGHGPVVGRRHRKLKRLLEAGLAVYAAHIPLDIHPEVGNNSLLAKALGVEVEGSFGSYKGIDIGVWGRLELRRETLAARLHDLLGGPVRFVAGGPERMRRVGVVTGSGAGALSEALRLGLDGFVSGEGPHHTAIDAMEGGINLYYGGHWATETFGVRALASHLQNRFGLEWQFLELPTGF